MTRKSCYIDTAVEMEKVLKGESKRTGRITFEDLVTLRRVRSTYYLIKVNC